MIRRPTTCALCESRCGLLADIEVERVVRLVPDPDHPVSRGHACVKGLQFHTVHHDPARVTRPMLREEGALVAVSWDAALSELGGRIRALREAHGPDAVGLYSGNAAGHSLGAVLGVAALQRALGTVRHYSCLTLDNAPQFVVQEEVFGAAMRTFAADFAQSDAILLIGTDPLSSQCSQAQSNPRGVGHLRAAAKRAQLWVADPRRSKTASVGRHLAVRPGGDVALLGWLLSEAIEAGRAIPEVREGDWGAVRQAVRRFDRAAVEAETGLSEAELTALRDALLGAERPLVWCGLGVLLSGEGTVGHWLATCLMAALGGLGRRGGWALPTGFDLAPLARRIGLRARDSSVRGRSGHPAILDTLPAADLVADAGSGALKALVVVGGNPVLSLPGAGVARALEGLDLLVSLDLFVNDTGTLADAVLPVRSFLSRNDLPLHLAGQRWADGEEVRPTLEPAVVAPVGEARGDFEILCGLARAAGLRPFGSRIADLALGAGLDPVRHIRPFLRVVGRTPSLSLHPGGRVHLAIPELLDALAARVPSEPGLRLLTSVRPVETLNHWMHRSRGALRRLPVARVHPATLARLGLEPGAGQLSALEADSQSLLVELEADPSVVEEVVVLPFGWGHTEGAVDSGGANPNGVLSASDLERFTGQPRSNGARVRLGPPSVG